MVLVVVLLFLIFPVSVFAWGFETHITIGLKILENTSFSLIKEFPVHFLLGNIFPDFFNLFKELSTFKKQLETHSWNTVSKLFKNAKRDYEKSFVHGYAAHLSADIVAHNYFVPHNILLVSKKKLFSHFLVEYAEESINSNEVYYTLRYLLDHASENGELFLRTFNVDKKYFEKQINLLKRGVTYQRIFGIAKIAEKIKRLRVKKFEDRCAYFGEQAYFVAKNAVEKGFFNLIKYDPSGKRRMIVARLQRDVLKSDIGKKKLREYDRNYLFIETHKPEFK
ncbi:zinc dependent phospholipase C family protein [Deferribacter autotrophicus]|uniref:Zinc dependent phospholipase C family protein n=1 Tax=Deferribacter autotrophicus TaxID=500465 RepID=A0A5A8F7U7_9BACT|nr:zinc dependent phospholipase C family protein [Deferribacter autotrophicus]KAA0259539.1 zinc dependent phospholipase C family protein [Deferribacter autotrophicus]